MEVRTLIFLKIPFKIEIVLSIYFSVQKNKLNVKYFLQDLVSYLSPLVSMMIFQQLNAVKDNRIYFQEKKPMLISNIYYMPAKIFYLALAGRKQFQKLNVVNKRGSGTF